MKKLLLLVLLLGIAAVGLLFSTGNLNLSKFLASPTPTTPPPTKVRLAYASFNQNIAVIVAQKKNFYKKYNLEVELQPVEKNVSAVIAGGKADLATSAPYTFLAAKVEGANLVWIGSIGNDNPFAIVANKTLKNIKTVGVTRIGGELWARSIANLKSLGVDTKKVDFQAVGSKTGQLEALKSKKVDAIGITEVDLTAFEKKGSLSAELKTLSQSSKEEKLQEPVALVARKEFLTKNKKAVEDLSRAIIEATNWVIANQEETVKIIAEYAKIKPQDAGLYVDSYIATVKNLKFSPDKEKALNTLVVLEETNPKAKGYSVDNFIDLGIYNSLKQSGFLKN